VWQDRRTADLCDRAAADGLEPLFRRAPGWCSIPISRAASWRWLLDHVPGARARANAGKLAFGTVDTLAGLEADGGDCTSRTPPTPAARCCSTSARGEWDDELLDLLRIPRA
jgi:glycerol kinase